LAATFCLQDRQSSLNQCGEWSPPVNQLDKFKTESNQITFSHVTLVFEGGIHLETHKK
jgi:hypothetical protein